MYYHYYLLRENPFTLTPDPKYLWMSEAHKEALVSMIYGVQERKGFVLVLGEVGTGKTTLIRHLLNQLGAQISTAFIFNTVICFEDLLYLILQELEVPCASQDRLEMVTALNTYLLHEAAAGRSVVLILDEAQHLSPEILEELRMLSNLETNHAKLLQIILVGQPELAQKLESPRLRQLRQRIALVVQLKPLNRKETRQYVAHRLQMAGFAGDRLFKRPALRLLHRAAHGIPRLMNIIADQALMTGYSTDTVVIGRRIVKAAIQDNLLLRTPRARVSRAPWTILPKRDRKPSGSPGVRRVTALLLSLAVVGGLALAWHGKQQPVWPGFSQVLIRTHGLWEALIYPRRKEQRSFQDPAESRQVLSLPQVTAGDGLPASPMVALLESTPSTVYNSQQVTQSSNLNSSGESNKLLAEVVVQPGDNLATLTRRVYGRADPTLFDFVKTANPELENINALTVGQRLRFPPLEPEAMVHQGPGALYRVHLLTVLDTKEGEVETLQAKLAKLGYQLQVVPIRLTSEPQLWYRIMAGDFTDREQAARFYQTFWMPKQALST